MKMWLEVSKLSLNTNNVDFIVFKLPQHSSPETECIKLGSFLLSKLCYVKFLGVLLDENLSWKYHLTNY